MGSSGLPCSLISCMSTFPKDVTRNVMCADLPCTSDGGVVVTVPSQEPARLFMVAKEFCAWDGTEATEDFCASGCAKATVDSDIRTTDSTKLRDFMFHSPQEAHLFFAFELGLFR